MSGEGLLTLFYVDSNTGASGKLYVGGNIHGHKVAVARIIDLLPEGTEIEAPGEMLAALRNANRQG